MTTQKRGFWYRKQAMLAYARRRGFHVSEDLFDDWIKKGLLGEAVVRVWPGRGSIALWPHEQLALFLNLLELRQHPNKIRLSQLCHMPVWRWLYWGELGGVSLPQVKRAISTWINFQHTIPEEQVRSGITQALRLYQGPMATDKRALIQKLTEIWTFKKAVEQDELHVLFDSVINVNPKKADRGPVKEWMNLAECWSLMHFLCLRVVQDERMHLDFPDEFWHWARAFILLTHAFAFPEKPRLASDPVLGSFFSRKTVQDLSSQACHALVTWLGLAQQNELVPWRTSHLRFLDPQVWRKREATSAIHTQIVFSQLVFPNGCPIPYLRNSLTISYQATPQLFIVDLPLF